MEAEHRQPYIDEFLSLRCAGDILNVVNPVINIRKEISECMAVLRHVRKIALKEPFEYMLYDFCSGNALLPITSAFLLPINYNFAIDKLDRRRDWGKVRKFKYIFSDVAFFNKGYFFPNSIITAIHPCRTATQIIDIYNNSQAEHLIMMPCCEGEINLKLPNLIKEKLGKYLSWVYYLSTLCKGKVNVYEDKRCESPKNAIIVARKG